MAGDFGVGNLVAGVLEGRLRRTANVLTFRVVEEIRKQSTAGAGAGTAAMMSLVGEGVGNERKRELAHSAVTRDVREAILDGYDRKVKSGAERNPQYVRRRNRLTGKLRPALANPNLYTSGPKEIRLLNTAILTSEAKHWARLNFGVEGNEVASGQSPNISFNLFGRQYDVGFNEGPRPGYRLPHGFFLDSSGVDQGYDRGRRGSDAFFPMRKSDANKLSAAGVPRPKIGGIEARYFLEDGLREFPRSFRRQYNRLVDEAIDGAEGQKVQRAVRKAVRGASTGNVNFQNLKLTVTD